MVTVTRFLRSSCLAMAIALPLAGASISAAPTATAPATQNGAETQPGKAWGPVKDGFQMSLSVNATSRPAVEPLVATVIIKNLAKDPRGFEWWGLTPVVQDADGKEVPKTRYGEQSNDLPAQGLAVMRWEPGGTQTFYVVLNRERDMTLSGTYSVGVSLWMQKDKPGEGATLESNKVTVKITDYEYTPPAP